VSGDSTRETVRLELEIDSPEDLRALRGAVLAARAAELSELERRAGRHSYGYGSDSARETMSEEVASHRRRHDMLGRILGAIDATGPWD
jgi:hypothetical protein